MISPSKLLNFRPRRVESRGRARVAVPTGIETTDALFVLLRRMRAPLIVVIVGFSVSTAGMMAMPGVDAAGNPYRLTLFDAFYQMTITLTTVGYTEAPHAFSYPQRMWLTLSIFILVISWAYTIGALLAALGDNAFRESLARQRFRRRVARIREPFLLMLGYGTAGRTVSLGLDEQRRRFVVVDRQKHQIDAASIDAHTSDVAALEGDCVNPAVLGMAGLGKDNCRGVLALTDDDEANLAVVMSVSLLRPDLPVYACCQARDVQYRMEDFSPAAVINPNDRYGGYLALVLLRPITHQLLTWLMDNDENRLPELRTGLAHGRWVVCGDGEFADQVAADLIELGLDVARLAPTAGPLDLGEAVGFVAGTDNDMTNIALAEHARLANPQVFVSIRQRDSMHQPLLDALDVDSVFVWTDLVAREVLARVVHPNFWRFVEETVQQSEEWSTRTRDRLVARCGKQVPERTVVALCREEAPAVVRWLDAGHRLTVGDLTRHPDDRRHPLAVLVLMVVRGEELILTPADDTELRVGDHLLLAGTDDGLADVSDALFYSATTEYLATGRVVASTWVWRQLTERRRARR